MKKKLLNKMLLIGMVCSLMFTGCGNHEKTESVDLTGITVYWLGMGQVAAPQEKLTPKQSNNLENIWKAVIEASGGEFVPNEYIAVSGEMNTGSG